MKSNFNKTKLIANASDFNQMTKNNFFSISPLSPFSSIRMWIESKQKTFLGNIQRGEMEINVEIFCHSRRKIFFMIFSFFSLVAFIIEGKKSWNRKLPSERGKQFRPFIRLH